MWYPVLQVHRPNPRPASRRGRPFRRPCARDPAGRYRRLSSYGRSYSWFLAEAAGDVVLGAAIIRRGEDTGGFPELDQLAEKHEGREIRHARGLLHIVGHNGDRVVILELVDQFLDLGSGDRV